MADTIKDTIEQLSISARYNQYCLDNGRRTSEQFNYFNDGMEKKALAEIKRIVSEARPEFKDINIEHPYEWNYRDGFNEGFDEYHANLMKALGESNG